MEKTVYLLLENGEYFEGKSFGAPLNEAAGEAVFTTGMTGYLETITDPSYFGQIVIQTFPMIGNYGVIPQDFENREVYLSAYIVKEWCQDPSNFRSRGRLDTFFKERGVPAAYGIDTRRLAKRIREAGVMNARLTEKKPPFSEEEPSIFSWCVSLCREFPRILTRRPESTGQDPLRFLPECWCLCAVRL